MSHIKQTMNNALSEDLVVRPEYLGMQTLLSPFAQHSSAQRLLMFGSHSAQSMVIEGSEQPRCMTGYENMVGQYEFSKNRIDQDIVIRKVIPKFNPSAFKESAMDVIPSWTVIYTAEDGKVHCMDVSTYTFLHDGFGYYNQMLCLQEERLHPGNLIPKGTKLTTSPSHKGDRWCMGTNANVIYMGEWGSTEDACIVSRSLAEKGTNLAILQTKLTIGVDDIPLDLYGDGINYKCFPNIGEYVRPDGVLIGLRRNSESTFVSDMLPSRLREAELIHDELHKAPPGAMVIDVDVYLNRQAFEKMKDRDDSIYKQFLDFHKAHEYYHNSVLDAYREFCSKEGENLPWSPEFNTLVVRSACLSNNKKFVGKSIKLYDARDPVEFITIVLTYAYKRKITLGSKLTDRCGGKGVVSEIRPDECMPVDDNGIRADIIMTPPSMVNRMNPAQAMEQFWNRAALQVMRNVRTNILGIDRDAQMEDWTQDPGVRKNFKQIFEYIIDFFNDFRPAYAKFMREIHTSDKDKFEFICACMKEGLYLINAYRTPNTPEDVLKVTKKYGIVKTPVTYKVMNKDTGEWHTVRTRKPMLIGSKYLMHLGKLPSGSISAVALGHVNQHEIPIKPKSKHIKSQNVIGLTPQKFGEDETCIMNMSIGPRAIARLYGSYATSPECVKQLAELLLKEPCPSALVCMPTSTQEIIHKGANISLLTHMLGVIGYDVSGKESS